MKKVLFLLMGFSGIAIAGSPGGSFIQNQNILQKGATYYVSSGTVNTALNLPYLTTGGCVQAGADGLLMTPTGSNCGTGSGGITSSSVAVYGAIYTSSSNVVQTAISTTPVVLKAFLNMGISYQTVLSTTNSSILVSTSGTFFVWGNIVSTGSGIFNQYFYLYNNGVNTGYTCQDNPSARCVFGGLLNLTAGSTIQIYTNTNLIGNSTITVTDSQLVVASIGGPQGQTGPSGTTVNVLGGYGISTVVNGSSTTVNLLTNTTSYIQNTNFLQSGATFYVSSGSVAGTFYANGGIQLANGQSIGYRQSSPTRTFDIEGNGAFDTSPLGYFSMSGSGANTAFEGVAAGTGYGIEGVNSAGGIGGYFQGNTGIALEAQTLSGGATTFVILAASGTTQTSDLQEWQSSSSVVLANITKMGAGVFPNVTVSSFSSASGNCVQFGTGGSLTSAGSPCGTGSGGVSGTTIEFQSAGSNVVASSTMNTTGQLTMTNVSGKATLGLPTMILDQNTLQSGATFYVSSGTVLNQLSIGNGTASSGNILLGLYSAIGYNVATPTNVLDLPCTGGENGYCASITDTIYDALYLHATTAAALYATSTSGYGGEFQTGGVGVYSAGLGVGSVEYKSVSFGSQTTDQQEWDSPGGVVLSSIAANGNAMFPLVAVSSALASNGIANLSLFSLQTGNYFGSGVGTNFIYSYVPPTSVGGNLVIEASTGPYLTDSGDSGNQSITMFPGTSGNVAVTAGANTLTIPVSGNMTYPATADFGLLISDHKANFNSTIASTVTVTIQGANSQTADLVEWKNNSGTVLSSVTAQGNAVFPVVTASSMTVNGPTVMNYIGPNDGGVYPATPLFIVGSTNTYLQLVMQNLNSGNGASTDFIATSDQGNNNQDYIDMGINSSQYSQSGFSAVPSTWAYLYSSDHGLFIGADTNNSDPTSALEFGVAGQNMSNVEMEILNDGAIINFGSTTFQGNVGFNGTGNRLPQSVNSFSFQFDPIRCKLLSPGTTNYPIVDNSTTTTIQSLYWDSSATQTVTASGILAPYGGGNINADFYFSGSSVTSGGIKWDISAYCNGPEDSTVIDNQLQGWTVQASTAGIVPATAGYVGKLSATLTPTNCNEFDIVTFVVARDHNVTSDANGQVRLFPSRFHEN